MFDQQQEYDVNQILENFKITANDDWTDWELKHSQWEHLPLGFSSKYNYFKNAHYFNLSAIPLKQEEIQYMVVEEKIKKKDKNFISKNIKLERRQPGNMNLRVMTKKFRKNLRSYYNQSKTNFKKITVKNNWKELKTINKTILDALPKDTPIKVEHLKTIGKLRQLNPTVERISWQSVKFKENKVYEADSVFTSNDSYFTKIAVKLMQMESDRYNIICHPNFLFTLLTVRGGVYPWNIQIEKDGNTLVLESYKGTQDEKQLNYLDLFVVNQNTSSNMPYEESVVKKACVNATKTTKIFQDLLASGELIELQNQPEHEIFAENQNDQDDEDEDEQNLDNLEKLRKYLKISLGKIDVYSYVEVDGIKQKSNGDMEEYLIRTFMETQSQGAWSKDMKVSPGTIITKEYHSNNCSLQKWICEAKLAGVNAIKTGFMGVEQNKSVLLNVNEVTVDGMQSILSFKIGSCWSTLKYILDLLVNLEDGTYVLSRAPFTPLDIKLFKIASKQEQFDQEQEEKQDNE